MTAQGQKWKYDRTWSNVLLLLGQAKIRTTLDLQKKDFEVLPSFSRLNTFSCLRIYLNISINMGKDCQKILEWASTCPWRLKVAVLALCQTCLIAPSPQGRQVEGKFPVAPKLENVRFYLCWNIRYLALQYPESEADCQAGYKTGGSDDISGVCPNETSLHHVILYGSKIASTNISVNQSASVLCSDNLWKNVCRCAYHSLVFEGQ